MSILNSYTRSRAVTPGDSADNVLGDGAVANNSRAIVAGTGGDITFKDENGNNNIIKSAIAGVIYPVKTKRIMATGTTASNITALW